MEVDCVMDDVGLSYKTKASAWLQKTTESVWPTDFLVISEYYFMMENYNLSSGVARVAELWSVKISLVVNLLFLERLLFTTLRRFVTSYFGG